jgi:H+/Cl- antiporter ClcA
MFISVFKWFVLATVTGILVGVSTTIFLKSLDWAMQTAGLFPHYFVLLPIALLTSTLLVKYLAPDAEGHGTEKIIDAVHQKQARINPMVVPVKLVATIVTIAFGGSAGKEGPCAQIGAGLASSISSLLRFDANDRKKLVICGISAGFATVFGTPIAGAIFGVEVLFVGSILYEVLFPSFVAGIVGYQVSSALGITYFTHFIDTVPEFTSIYFLAICLSGVFFGLCSYILIEMLKQFERLSAATRVDKPLRALIGGTGLVVLAFMLGTEYLGLGLETIDAALRGENIAATAFLYKSLFTSITLSFGGSGGIVTPIFFVGATSGSLYASVMGLDPMIFASIGMVALLAGAANTPISASIMAAELFGPQLAPYAALSCVISFLITGHRSVYPSQILAVTKSTTIRIKPGMIMENIHSAEIKPRKKSLTAKLVKGINRIKRRSRK